MNLAVLGSPISLSCFLVLALACRAQVRADEGLPPATSVLNRVLSRADAMEHSEVASQYTYEKRQVAEELDNAGKPTKTSEDIYKVTPIEGVPFSRLIRTQDRDLTPEEVRNQDRKEQQFRRKVAGKDRRANAKDKEGALNADLINRYDFKVVRREKLGGRASLVLSFHPKTQPAIEKSVEDKVLDRLAGEVWVDEEDAEVARVRVGLTADLQLGLLGMIGAIKQCDVTIERQRLADGVWVNKTFAVLLGGRKVFSPMRYRTEEDCFDFRKP